MKSILPLIFLLIVSWLHASQVDVYFGTGGGEAKGIYHASLDPETGQLSEPTLAAELQAPEFLALHPDRTRLYAVGKFDKKPAVVAYQVHEAGALTLLNWEVIPEGGAAHIAVHPSGDFLMTAQYGVSTIALFPLNKDGSLRPCHQVIKHEGSSGVVAKRQEKPHPHWVGFSPDGRFALVPDLGLDQIVIYQILPDHASIRKVGAVDSIPGGGPRHMKFSVDGQYIFLLNELTLSVSTFAYDADSGTAELLFSTRTLDDAMEAENSYNSGSEIRVHPNGRFVYAANRGHDSVTAFQVEPGTGRLHVVDVEPVRGAWPRNINIDGTGRWLLAAGARSDTVAVFEIDPSTGELTFSENPVITVPKPFCVLLND